MDRIKTYKEFWPFYLREHSQLINRRLHFIGTSISLLLIVFAIVESNPGFLILALVNGYGFAWIGHFGFEKNRPATFRYPLWSFISDWRMWFLMLTGQALYRKEPNAISKTST